jgi:hypothetical protein
MAKMSLRESVRANESQYKGKNVKYYSGNVSGKRHTYNFSGTGYTRRVGWKSEGHMASGLGAWISGSKYNLCCKN